jgi:hypothetical protein
VVVMGIEQEIKETIALLTFLQFHINNTVITSFNDLSFQIEYIIMEILNIIDDSNWKNVNGIKLNYPAIDMIENKKDIALQVTTVANAAKARNTIEVYKKHNLSYKELIIIGFVKSTKPKIDKVRIVGIDYLINRIKYLEREKIEKINVLLHKEIPLQLLNPIDDKICLEIVLGVINRSAIRDLTNVEGDYESMIKGLREIKEIIHTGQIDGKQIRAKPLAAYNINIKIELEKIEYNISRIIQICNKQINANHRSCFICLTAKEKNEIDKLKIKTAHLSNELAKNNCINITIKTSNCRTK